MCIGYYDHNDDDNEDDNDEDNDTVAFASDMMVK